MPGPEIQVRQALPEPWVIVDGRRLSVERADFATIPWADGRPPSKGAKVGFALGRRDPGRDSLLKDRAGLQRQRGGPQERAEGLRACPTGASPPRGTLDAVIVAAAISYDRRRAD
jgi:hypothetical protein